MSKATGRDPHKTGPIARLYAIACEIVDGMRKAYVQSGVVKAGKPFDIRVPILMHGTDLRVIIESGPTTAMRNAVEHAQMEASGGPVTHDSTETLREAIGLLTEYAVEIQRAGMHGEAWDNDKDRRFWLRIGACVRGLDAMQAGI